MYWLYYVYSIFNVPITTVSLINIYNDSNYEVTAQLPIMELNMSLFDIQNTVLYFIVWNTILLLPYLVMTIKITHSYDTYCVLFLICIINVILYKQYIPILVHMSIDYYKIHQIEHNSVHINVEYKIIEIIYSLLTHIVIVYTVLISIFKPLARKYATIIYIILTPWNQPIYIFIAGLILLLILWEISNIVIIIYLNYLKKIAGH